MKFPWHKYEELTASRRSTLQIFITNNCNLSCKGCFARNVIGNNKLNMTIDEYNTTINDFLKKGGKQINLIGGEPLLHPQLNEILNINRIKNLKTTIYTNGTLIDKFNYLSNFVDLKIRISIYSFDKFKAAIKLPKTSIPIDICFIVSKNTTVEEMIKSAIYIENNFNCKTFFISSIRELDNLRIEFFDDTELTMPVIKYKELVHEFLNLYEGNMQIHISKRGVFESTKTVAENKCNFANYFIGGKIIQCPYDIINKKFEKDYKFNKRYCQQNNSCLMSKIIFAKKKNSQLNKPYQNVTLK